MLQTVVTTLALALSALGVGTVVASLGLIIKKLAQLITDAKNNRF